MDSVFDPISPELALVSPDLAQRARAELPDRPWEAFLPAGPVTVLRLSMPVALVRPAPEVVVQPGPVRRRRRRRRVPVGGVVLAAFAALLIAGSVLPPRDAPTLSPLSAKASVPGSTSPTQTTAPTPTPPAAPAVTSVSRPETTRDPRPIPTALPRARPFGGYIFGGGYLRVDGTGRSIPELHVTLACLGPLTVRRVGVGVDGRFAARRLVPGRGTLTLVGVFTSSRRVHGTVRVSATGCGRRALGFSGRLS